MSPSPQRKFRGGTLAIDYFFERTHCPHADAFPPRVLAQSAAAKVRYEKDTMRQTTSGLLEVLEEYPIIVRSVNELVFGYPDPLVKLAKNVQPPGQSLPYESFGFFVGVS